MAKDGNNKNNSRLSNFVASAFTGSGALAFITLMGIVSLFSDMTHEGARSILGEYLSLTGASGAAIGFVSGLGELLGYGLRIASGMIADRSKKYWTMVILGYTIQVMAIPALALVPDQGWIIACSLVVMERVGKAVKKPAKNTLVSFASAEVGQGMGFAWQEFLDQLGAFLGPVILFVISRINAGDSSLHTCRISFLFLGIPGIITVLLVLLARHKYPHPEEFDKTPDTREKFVFRKDFIFYMVAICLFAFGFIDFPIITLQGSRSGAFPLYTLSLLYALAMAVDAVAALFFGWLFDKAGLKSLMISTALSALFPVLIFSTKKPALIIAGIVMWGIGMGAQESIMKAAVGKIIPKSMRSTGFGIFETGFGIAWFLGSWITGYFYDHNVTLMIGISVTAQFLAVVFYGITAHRSSGFAKQEKN